MDLNATTLARAAVATAMAAVTSCGGPDPKPLARRAADVVALAVDDVNVYWLESVPSGSLMKLPVAGGMPTTLASGQVGSGALAIDSKRVYWTNTSSGTVLSVEKTGGAPVVLADALQTPRAIAVSGDEVFWAGANDSTILKTQTVPGTAPSLVTQESLHDVRAIAVDANNLYWVETIPGLVMARQRSADVALSSTVLSTQQDGPIDIAVDATHVYWANAFNGGAISSMPKNGSGAARVLGARNGEPNGLAIDGENAYWIGTSRGFVGRVPLMAGTATILATVSNPFAIAVSQSSVLFATHEQDGVTSTIEMLAK